MIKPVEVKSEEQLKFESALFTMIDESFTGYEYVGVEENKGQTTYHMKLGGGSEYEITRDLYGFIKKAEELNVN